MESRVIQLTEASGKYGNLNIRPCGRDFFPPDVFGGSSKEAGLGTKITIKADGLPNPIKTDIPTDIKTHKPRWIFRERKWVKDFVKIHKLNIGDKITIRRVGSRRYSITANGRNALQSSIQRPQTTRSETIDKTSGYNLRGQIKADIFKYLSRLIEHQANSAQIVSALRKLGHLPKDLDGTIFVRLLKHPDSKVRYWAVRNLGKLSSTRYLQKVSSLALRDYNSVVRREATSSIGRMRSELAIPVLKEILTDADPKVVLQAIRGLLVFKSKPEIKAVLLKVGSHPNEIIQTVIKTEYGNAKTGFATRTKHTECPEFMKNVLVQGDALEVLRTIPEESIHLSFTSPPYYNARDYSIYQSYDQYLKFLSGVFAEVHRITKEGRFFILNTSPIIIPRVSRKHSSKRYPITFDVHAYLTKMGWEFIDDIIWLKPEASAKNRNAGFLQHRKPLGYKPNCITEYLMVYRKKTTKLLDWNMKQYNEATIRKSKITGCYETSNVWRISPTFDKIHSAVFPDELCRRVIVFYSYIGDLVLDPFAGSGTFGNVAMKLGRYFFGIEIEPRYVKRATEELEGLGFLSNKTFRVMTEKTFKGIARKANK